MPGFPLGLNMELILGNFKNSVSKKTWSDYRLSWSRWCSFCQDFGLDSLVVTSYVSLSFVSSLLQANLSPASISKILAGVSFFLKFAGLPSLTSFFQVNQVLKGFRRSKPLLDNRRPISAAILVDLLKVLEVVCFSEFELILFRAVFSVAFFGALRIGEFTSENRRSSAFLLKSHVIVYDGSLSLFLCRSKSLPTGQGHWISLASSTNPTICPVLLVSRYMSIRPCSDDSFFIHQDLSSLTRYQFSAVLAASLKRLNLSGFCFSSHSFRIGAATTADSLGFPAETLKRIGRWGSDRYKIYVRPDLLIL